MSWLDGLFGRKKRGRLTTTQMAESLAALVQDGVANLINNLESLGLARDDPQRFKSVAFITECLLFEAFQIDIISSREFGPHGEAISAQLSEYLFQIAQNVAGLQPKHRSQFERLQLARFAEYAEALKAGAGDQAWGQKLSSLAAERILPGKGRDFAVLACLSIDVTNRFKHFGGMGSWAEIVEGPR